MRDTCKHVQPVFGSVLDLSMISVYHVLRLNLGHKECKCIYNYIYIHIIINIYSVYNTSSTAQGGGGSFKNRKPIGEVGCCESGMAERSH